MTNPSSELRDDATAVFNGGTDAFVKGFDWDKPLTPCSHEEICKRLFEREQELRMRINELYERLAEVRNASDLIWLEMKPK